MSCWRHDYNHREYICRCNPVRADDAGYDIGSNTEAQAGEYEAAHNEMTRLEWAEENGYDPRGDA